MLFNRDISWLSFNERVLQEAEDPAVPLLERIRFLAISSSNLDEFSRVRYPVIRALSQLKNKIKKKILIEKDSDLTEQVQNIINEQLRMFGNILNKDILLKLEAEGTVLYYNRPINELHKEELRDLFVSRVLSFIQPVYLVGNPSQNFEPKNGQLYFIVTLKNGKDRLYHYIINIPSDKLNRFFELSPIEGKNYIIFIDDIIRENISFIFPGFTVHSIYSIKFNRDAELYLDDDFADDILDKIEKHLKKRDIGNPTRFLYEPDMPLVLQLFLASSFLINQEEMFEGGRYHNLKDLADLPVKNEQWQYPRFNAVPTKLIKDSGNIFKAMEEDDILLHFPYEKYDPILTFFNQAAIDPHASEIYISLYRVASGSHVVNALISAAKNGKKVIVFVELKARFDEANNIKWSREMKEAGIKLIYSLPRIKVHSKIAMVVRNHNGSKQHYAVISTGNFNESTARFYTDHTLLTTDNTIANDLMELFTFLQHKDTIKDKLPIRPKVLLISAFNMVEAFQDLIEKEIKKINHGKKGLIRIKVNNLEEPEMIEKLYRAAKAGVTIQLIVRSICSLVPGIEGESHNITVRRIVDRFLEHSRLFIFGESNDSDVIIGSADWMTRNLYHRIEVCTPITNKKIKQELLDYFELQWKDTDKATELLPDGEYKRLRSADPNIINAQLSIQEYLNSKV